MATTVSSTIDEIQSKGDAARNEATLKKNGATLDKNAFLKLLTAQLQYQDPTKPMDNTAFVAQLAQFSSLEAMSNVNDTLTKLLSTQNSTLQNSAIDMVGKTAVFPTNEVLHTVGKANTITADLSKTAINVTMVVSDATGNVVRTAGLGPSASGKNTFSWDGKNNDGENVATGTYTVALLAQDTDDNPVPLTQYAHERITGVTFVNGEAKVKAGGVIIPTSQISEIIE